MLDYDDLARIARTLDSEAEQLGEGAVAKILAQHGVIPDAGLQVGRQRALRVSLIEKGELDTLKATSFTPVNLTLREQYLYRFFLSAWIDGFVMGLRIKKESN